MRSTSPRRRIMRRMMLDFVMILLLVMPGWGHPVVRSAGPTLIHSDPTTHSAALPAAVGDGLGACPAVKTAYLPLVHGGTAADSGFGLVFPNCRILVRGFGGSTSVIVPLIGDFKGSVSISLEGLPAGVTGSFVPQQVTTPGTSVLSLTAADSVRTGRYEIQVVGTAGALRRVASLTLVVVEPLVLTGTIGLDTGGSAPGVQVTATVEGTAASATTASATDGRFTVILPLLTLPARVLVVARRQEAGRPEVMNSRWTSVAARVAATLDPILLPDPAGAEMTLVSGGGKTGDGSVVVEELPGTITKLYARTYDPDVNRNVFPGEFAENGRIPLNSAGFTWLEALDAQGQAVDALGQAVMVRSRISRAQWRDLEDIHSGTDRIEAPIYTYDEVTNHWEQLGDGWLEDGDGHILSEEYEPMILDGTFPGEIFAAHATTHFSFLNVDYPYNGPWTLSRIDRERRQNDCLDRAMNLAKAILRSQKGHDAYAKVNQAGADLDDELGDGKGPELKTDDLDWDDEGQTNGEYSGDAGGSETEIHLNNKLWDRCDDPGKKDDTILLMASTILHETAHWKDDVKKFPGTNDETAPDGPLDTPGEEGKQLEKDLFGGDLHYFPDDDSISLDSEQLDGSVVDTLIDPENWPPVGSNLAAMPDATAGLPQALSPLKITISFTGTTFLASDRIVAQVTYQNDGSAPIRVLDRIELEDYPLRFDIQRVGSLRRIGFRGPELDRAFRGGDYLTLQPGQTLVKQIDINRSPSGAYDRYSLRVPGDYQIQAVYNGFFGLPETASNIVSIRLNGGGALGGTVTNARTGTAVAGAQLRLLQSGALIAAAISDASGAYSMPFLPNATYTLETRAPGFLRSIDENVQVATGSPTTLNIALSPPPELALGQSATGAIDDPTEPFTYTFTARYGDRVLVRMAATTNSLRPELALLRPDGLPLLDGTTACGDWEFHYTVAEALCMLTATGTYQIVVSGHDGTTGPYALYLQRTSNPGDASPIGFGEKRSGTVANPTAMVAYTFGGTAGERVLLRIAATGTTLQPDVRLYRPDGTPLTDGGTACADWEFHYTVAEVLCALDTSGSYTILAGSHDQGTGGFGLFLQRTNSPAGATTIAYGVTTSGNIAGATETDAYRFTGAGGDMVLLRMAATGGTTLQPDVRLYRPDGTPLTNGGTACADWEFHYTVAEIMCTIDASATYTILVGSHDKGSGDYSLSLQRLNGPGGATQTAYGATHTATIGSATATQAYRFMGAQGDSLLVRMAATVNTLQPDVRLYRPDGTPLTDGGTACADWEFHYTVAEVLCALDTSGSYTILAGSHDQGTGGFGLFLQRTNSPAGATGISYGTSNRPGSITGVAAVNAYTFTGTLGDRIVIQMRAASGSAVQPEIRLYRPDGTPLTNGAARCDDWEFSFNTAEVICTLDVSGIHAILAGSHDKSTGTYTLTLAKE